MDSRYRSMIDAFKRDPVLWLVKAAVAVLLGLYFLFFLYRALRLVFYPHPIDFVESYVLEQTRMLGAGDNIYNDFSQAPFVGAVYAPVYMSVLALMSPLFGLSFTSGRILSLLSALAVGYLIYSMLRSETRDRQISISAALFFFSSHYVYSWSPLYRPDFLAVLMAVGGIWLVYNRRSIRSWHLAAPVFLLCLFTRQSLVAAPAAAILYLFFVDRKASIRLAVTMLFGGVAALVVLEVASGGHFLEHIFFALGTNPISLGHAAPFLYKMLIMYPILIGFGGFYLLGQVKNSRLSLFGVWALLALSVATLTASKEGAWINYFIEPFAALCILSGLAWNEIRQEASSEGVKSRLTLAVSALLLIQALVLFHAPNLPAELHRNYFFYHFIESPTPDERREQDLLANYVQTSPGPVLSLDGFFFPGQLREIDLGPEPLLYLYLERAGMWQRESSAGMIRERVYGTIVLKAGVDQILSIDQDYGLAMETEGFSVYVAKPEVGPTPGTGLLSGRGGG